MDIFREFSVTWGIGLPDATLTPVAGVAAVTEPPDRLRVMESLDMAARADRATYQHARK
jgi:hypothetical protein